MPAHGVNRCGSDNGKVAHMKQCTKCGETKPRTEFYKKTSRKDGLTSWCQSCIGIDGRNRRAVNPEKGRESSKKYRDAHPEVYRQWQLANPDSIRHRRIKRTYGLTEADWQTMFDAQGGVCLICGKPEIATYKNGKVKRMSVDHCHTTGAVRGLLCSKCNHGLGNFDDNPELLVVAAEYLRHTRLEGAA